VFDPFLRGWFDRHAFQSVTTAQFLDYLRKNLLAAHPKVMSEAELAEWLHGPGIPASAPRMVSPRLTTLNNTRDAWLAGTVSTKGLNASRWSAAEWMKFLNDIDGKAGEAQLRELDQVFALARTSNSEVAFRFYRAAIRGGYKDVRPALEAFLMSVGRQKFVVPLYAALNKTDEDRAWAQQVYQRARPRYHPETQASVDKEMAAK
jgi:hypothetical protein